MADTHNQLNKLLKKHIDDITPHLMEVGRKRTDFIRSLGITSATIASFSLLTLQVQSSVLNINKTTLIIGFVVLVANVFLAFLVLRLWIALEEWEIDKSVKSLSLEEELVIISGKDPNLTDKKNKSRWVEIINIIKNKDYIGERKRNQQFGRFLFWLSNINILIFLIGIVFICISFWSVLSTNLHFQSHPKLDHRIFKSSKL